MKSNRYMSQVPIETTKSCVGEVRLPNPASVCKFPEERTKAYLYLGSLMIIFIACSQEALDGTRCEDVKSLIRLGTNSQQRQIP